jgi:hypothetical protein
MKHKIMKKTIISLGIVTLNLCTSFALPISAQTSDSSKRQNPSKSIQSNGFSFELIGCQLIQKKKDSNGLIMPGTWCDIKIINKVNSPRILRYNGDPSRSSYFSSTSGYLHSLVRCSDTWKASTDYYCQDTFQVNESKILSTRTNQTAIKKNDFINTIVLMFELLEASGRKRFKVIFNKDKTGEISVTSDSPIVYGKNAIAQDTVQQEVKLEELKFQLLYCQNLGKDLGFDGIEDGICEFKVTNTSNTDIGLAGYSYGDAIDLGGNKHPFGGFRLKEEGVSLSYRDGQYFVEFLDLKNNPPRNGYDSQEIYPDVTVRGTIYVRNIFPDNTAFKKLNIVLKITKDKKEKEITVVFGAKNIPILPAK